ncbi:MAG: radical SAM protein [Nanoarchaeota archaeon]|nr:radical SAM protein [Nanoarchaeota archaeon]
MIENLTDLPEIKDIRIELTQDCNLDCGDCYLKQFEPKKNEKYEELSDKEIFKIIDDAVALNVPKISFSGGEPSLRYDKLRKVLAYAKEKDLETMLLTNAALLTQTTINELKKDGLSWVRTSLNGSNEEINNISRGGNFNKIISSINQCRDSGINVILRSTINKYNCQDIENIIGLAKELKVDVMEFQPYLLLTRKDLNEKFMFSIEQQKEVGAKLVALKKENLGILDIRLMTGFYEFLTTGIYKGLERTIESNKQDGVNFYTIDAHGIVRTCGCTDFVAGSIRKNSLKEIIANDRYFIDLRNRNQKRYCPKCEYTEYCNPCPSKTVNYFGTVNAAPADCPDVRERMSVKFFEDVKIGDILVSRLSEPITTEECLTYQQLTGEKNVMHNVHGFMPGYFIAQKAGGLMQEVSRRKDGFMMGLPAIDGYGVKFIKPIKVGHDRFYVADTIIDKQDRPDKNYGQITVRREVRLEHDELATLIGVRFQVFKRDF